MATKYLRGAGTGAWNTDASWSTTSSAGAANTTKPTASDAVILDAGSAASSSIDATAACLSLNCTGYTGTLTQNANITVSGNVTLVSGMTFNPQTYTFAVNATSTIDFGGKSAYNFNFGNATITYTITDLTVTGTLGAGGTSTVATISGTINVSGSIYPGTAGSFLGGTINMIGTGSISCGSGDISSSININTAGTITLSGTIRYKTGTFTYTAGTVVNSGSTIYQVASATYNTGASMSLNNFTFGNATTTATLNSDMYLAGALAIYNGSSALGTFAGTGNVYLSGDLSIPHASSYITGRTVVFTGTGTQATTITTAGSFRSNISITKTGGSITGLITYTPDYPAVTSVLKDVTYANSQLVGTRANVVYYKAP